MPKFQDLTGQKFERLEVVRRAPSRNGMTYWLCLCSCGIEVEIQAGNLRAGRSGSCGCLRSQEARARALKGESGWSARSLYNCWNGARRRCVSPDDHQFANYGARGISMYAPWVEDFEVFESWVDEHLGPKPDRCTLDRIDNDGNYEPGNLRWANPKEQAGNRRTVKTVTAERDLWRQRALALGWTR